MALKPTRLALGRSRASNNWPYLNHALFSLTPIPEPKISTMGVDERWRLYYNPDVNWTIDEIAAVLYHEVWHLLFEHPDRAKRINAVHMLWNIAADMEINDGMRQTGIKLPGTPCDPRQMGLPDNKLAEFYYDKVKDKAVEIKVGDPMPGSGNCGSAAHGQHMPWEVDGDGDPDKGTDGIGPVEAKVIRGTVAQAVQEHVKARGTVPGTLARWAERFQTTSRVDWRVELRSAITAASTMKSGAHDYSYCRPSRRQSAYGNIIMPTLVQPIPNLAIVIDTSGSMSDRMLCQALTETAKIAMHAKINILTCDAEVHQIKKELTANEIKKMSLIGGGGTDMGVGLAHAAKLRPRPDVIVCLTDGYTPWPDHNPLPSAKVIIGLVADGTSPKWARTINIKDPESDQRSRF